MSKPYTITVRDFKERITNFLADLPDDSEIYFGTGDLSFHRIKPRKYHDASKTVAALVQIEFNQLYTVDEDPEASD
ncbi:hypothetical protein [Burkholderia gladioli]|uniref:hypothetical protein n=1 Tax=Burkholderia gladioli TaxID=28095 RepID=UPI00164095D0|nr:hypothetical protein [Burkholderia gladioli]